MICTKMRALRRLFATVDFGSREVPKEEKQKLVNEVFTRVAEKYDIMNDAMSLGIHRLWKDQFISDMGNFHTNSNLSFLDVAGGTGDIGFRIVEKLKQDIPSFYSGNQTWDLTISDINAEMLEVGKQRASALGYNINWVQANAEELPFEDNKFDFYTIAFGIRNVTDRLKALKEAKRVLKLGGRFMCLEFSKINYPVLDQVYSLYSQNVIPAMGKIIANDRDSYQYLVDSIEKFPSQEEFAALMNNAGFEYITHRDLTFGVVAIHSGIKL
ncbi:unnamed protein product [Blepharisma stoltei]|uniref:2-methoxy-6-polyprenyl-1,4-benzoquinol methylase, mitochondrial n=1 Tax=Blepharisma stoltei TaxID=1481888 RepID=A0AAU9IXT8_9CILI|nr:unnamed protein product [Blepharisma stoltei]